MYKKHKIFKELPNDTILWKYMDLSKFIYLLREKKLYLNRTDNFDDKYECTLTALDKKFFWNVDENYWKKEVKQYFVSCWVESNKELALMWRTYGKQGVAIRSTVGRLTQCMEQDKEHDIYMSRIRYVDPATESSQIVGDNVNFLRFPMTKRFYFEQEQEFRLLCFLPNNNVKGISIPVDTNKLIEKVFVYPQAPNYFLDIVNQELNSNGLKIKADFSQI